MTEGVRWKLVHKHVVQDVIIPMRELESAVEEFHRRFEVYPLLVYPIRCSLHSSRRLVPLPARFVGAEVPVAALARAPRIRFGVPGSATRDQEDSS